MAGRCFQQASLCLALSLFWRCSCNEASCDSCSRSISDGLDADLSLAFLQRAAAHRQQPGNASGGPVALAAAPRPRRGPRGRQGPKRRQGRRRAKAPEEVPSEDAPEGNLTLEQGAEDEQGAEEREEDAEAASTESTSDAGVASNESAPEDGGALEKVAEDLQEDIEDGGNGKGNLISCATAFCFMYAVGCGIVALYYRVDVAILVLWLGSAAFFYVAAGNDLTTTIYALVQIVTTVGYGDFVPSTDAGKMAMTAIIFFASVIIAGVISELIDFLSKENLELIMSAMKKAEEALAAGERHPMRLDKQPAGLRKLASSLAFFLFFLLAGTVYYATLENCTCSFGKTRVEGCLPESCYSTGGYTKTWTDAVYFSVVTLSTVGFGDYSANTWGGRLFGIIWMLFGVAAMVNFVTASAAYIQNTKQDERDKMITKTLFEKFDADHSGTLDRLEFLQLQLQMNNLVDSDVLDSIMKQFDIMDASKDGQISVEELKSYYHVKELES